MSIIMVIIYFVLLFASLLIIKEVIPWIRHLRYYKSQGIPFTYTPIIGFFGNLVEPNKPDELAGFKNLLNNKLKDIDIMAFNSYHTTSLSFFLKDLNLIKEFFIKELDCTKRFDYINASIEIGFFLESGHRAMELRGIFNEFFKPSHVRIITPEILRITDGKIQELKDELWGAGTPPSDCDFKEYDLRELLPTILIDIVNGVLFGSVDFPTVEGEKLPVILNEVIELSSKASFDPINMLTFGAKQWLGLDSRITEAKRLGSLVELAIKKMIEKRVSQIGKKEFGDGVLDLMLKHNQKYDGDKKMTEDEIVGNIIGFIIAGLDTTKNTIEVYIKNISKKPEVFEKIVQEELKKIFHNKEDWANYDNYDKTEYLNATIYESMRVMPLGAILFPKELKKDVKLGKYKLRKGSHLYISVMSGTFNEEFFENHLEFEPERHMGEKKKLIKKNSYIPFSAGKRNCVGRNLAELIQRLVLGRLLSSFEIKDNGRKPRNVIRFVYGVDKCDVLLKPRVP